VLQRILLAAVLALLLASCASRVTYPGDFPLSATLFSFRHAPVHGRIPRGWFSPAEDTLAPALAAWLIQADYAASISVRELHLDNRAQKDVGDQGLALLARLSFAFRSTADSAAVVVGEPQQFSLAGKDFRAYECRSHGIVSRIVLFAVGNRYFECEAAPANGKGTAAPDAGTLFRIQQSVIGSLVF